MNRDELPPRDRELEWLQLEDRFNSILTEEFLSRHVELCLKLRVVQARMARVASSQQVVENTAFNKRSCISAVFPELQAYEAAQKALREVYSPRPRGVIDFGREQGARLRYRQDYEQQLVERRNALHEAGQRLTRSVVKKYLEPLLLATIEEREERSKQTFLEPASTVLLTQAHPGSYSLPVGVQRRIYNAIENLRSASLGLAGPRGSGKTTILDAFCPGITRTVDRLTVRADAPVVFDAREYFLSLFTKVCEAAVHQSELGLGAPQSTVGLGLDASPLSKTKRRAAFGAALAGVVLLAAIVAAGSLVILQGNRLVNGLIPIPEVSSLRGYLLMVTSVIIASVAVAIQVRQRVHFRTAFVATVERRYTSTPIALGAILIAFLGAETLSSAIPGSPPVAEWLFLPVAAVVGLLLVSWCALHAFMYQLRQIRSIQARMSASKLRSDISISSLRYLHEIRYQQSFSHTTSGRAASGMGGMLTLEVGSQRQESAARIPWSLPEVVGELRKYLSLLGSTRKVVIGIDELDKISPPSAAVEFVDSIKALFGVPGVYFIVSVSMDAIVSFERRGTPFRDSFNSAFDEVLRVPYLRQVQTAKFLRERVLDMPVIFTHVCHAASGGLPRDAIRYASKFYELVDRRLGNVEIERGCRELASDEVEASLNAISVEVAKLDADPYVQRALVMFGDAASADSFGLNRHIGAMMRLEHNCREDPSIDPQAKQMLLRLLLEAIAQLSFWDTIIELSIKAAADEGSSPAVGPAFRDLSAARRAAHPSFAVEQIQVVRSQYELRALGDDQ